MVAEGVPGQFVGDAVVLVQIVTAVCQHDVGIERLERLEIVLQGRALVWEVAAPKSGCAHLGVARTGQQPLGGGTSLVFTFTFGAQRHPDETSLRMLPHPLQQRAAAADLDVVAVGAEQQDRLSTRV